MIRRYLRHGVGVQSAALAFYLLFMLFPLLIFISALLGSLQLDRLAILASLEELLPRQVVALAEVYLRHVGEHPSARLLTFGLVFSLYFPMRAANALMRAVRTAYHLGPPRSTVRHYAKSLLYTALLIGAIALTLTAMTVGEGLLRFAVAELRLRAAAAALWARLRFPVAAAAGFFALFSLYALSQDRRRPWRELWPGTVFSLTVWLALSWLYSLYVERIADYSALYGSIGAVIVLLMWLYLSAAVLILGAELNGTLMALRREKSEE